MSKLKKYFTENHLNNKEEYLLNETLQLDEETNPYTECENNKYFELSDYDMKVTRDFEYLFGEEKDNIHFNKNYEDDYLQNKSPSERLKYLIHSNNNLKIPLFILNFIPLILIVFSLFKVNNIVGSQYIKDSTYKFVVFLLIMMNFIIYYILYNHELMISFLVINNLYLMGLIMIFLKNTRRYD